AERASEPRGGLRGAVEEALFASVGVVSLTKERADGLVGGLARRGRATREEASDRVEDARGRVRGETARFGERTSSSLAGVLRELGLVTRGEWEEIDLRLSQLEHRLRLLEMKGESAPGRGARSASP
ncbi:MAG: hypothetical protein M3123_02015, partial [Actinomycetota bacterium]|nr:hypothetical protein [Actinomycetota bacterium]